MDDPAVDAFVDARALTKAAVKDMVSASYLYRLSVTVEEQQMQELLKKIIAGKGTKADFQSGVELERSAREKYIDRLESEEQRVRDAVVTMTTAANAIRDSDLRSSAVAVTEHYNQLVKACARLSQAQRHASSVNEAFFQSLVDDEAPRELEIARWNQEVAEARASLELLIPTSDGVFASFEGTRLRNSQKSIWQ